MVMQAGVPPSDGASLGSRRPGDLPLSASSRGTQPRLLREHIYDSQKLWGDAGPWLSQCDLAPGEDIKLAGR